MPTSNPSPEKPRLVTLQEALRTFAACARGTQGQRHIRPLHWYTACRLVIEGGFDPDVLTPRPPFRIQKMNSQWHLLYDPDAASPGEQTVFGGLKTKNVDVVTSLPGIGPVIAVSMKGTLNAFRNLTNRMEEAAGDCTNLHLAYPGLVYAFWHVFRANREGRAPADTPAKIQLQSNGDFKPQDVAVRRDGSVTSFLERYLFAMSRLSGRSDMRAEPSSYEAVGITLVDVAQECTGEALAAHPPEESPLRHTRMFESIYREYDLRFVYQSPDLKKQTRRHVWSERSDAFRHLPTLDYAPRTGEPEDETQELEEETRD